MSMALAGRVNEDTRVSREKRMQRGTAQSSEQIRFGRTISIEELNISVLARGKSSKRGGSAGGAKRTGAIPRPLLFDGLTRKRTDQCFLPHVSVSSTIA